MATTRRKIRSLTDLNAKQTLQKLDGNDVIFEASGSLINGKVTSAVPLSASSGVAISGASGLLVQQGNVNLHSGAEITQTGGIVKVSGDLQVSSGHFKVGNNVESLIANTSTGFITAQNGFAVSGSTETSGSLTVGGNASFTANKGATVNGSALTANAGLVVNNSALLVNNGGISGSATLQAGGSLTVGGNANILGNLDVVGNMTVRGTPTIINTDVLEVKDNILVVNKVSGSDSAYDSGSAGLYVNRGNFESASLLWVSSSNDWQLQKTVGGVFSSADLVVNKLKPLLISGSAGVSVNSNFIIAATASLHTSGAFNNINITASNSTVEGVSYNLINLDSVLHAIDTALSNVAGANSTSIQNAYKALRFQYSGTLDANGEAIVELPLTQISKTAFPVADFNYITTDVMIDESGRWVNDLVAVDMEVSGVVPKVYVSISAAAAANTGFRLIAINENTSSFSI